MIALPPAAIIPAEVESRSPIIVAIAGPAVGAARSASSPSPTPAGAASSHHGLSAPWRRIRSI
jgi:hypothetical protein